MENQNPWIGVTLICLAVLAAGISMYFHAEVPSYVALLVTMGFAFLQGKKHDDVVKGYRAQKKVMLASRGGDPS